MESILARPDSEDGIASISNDLDAWVAFLESDALLLGSRNSRTEDKNIFLRMVVHLLGSRICVDNALLPEYQNSIILKTLNASKFLAKVRQTLSDLTVSAIGNLGTSQSRTESSRNESTIDISNNGFIKDIYDFCSFVAKRLPESARDYLKNLLTTAYGLVKVDASVAGFEDSLKALIIQLETFSKREEAKVAVKTRRLTINYIM